MEFAPSVSEGAAFIFLTIMPTRKRYWSQEESRRKMRVCMHATCEVKDKCFRFSFSTPMLCNRRGEMLREPLITGKKGCPCFAPKQEGDDKLFKEWDAEYEKYIAIKEAKLARHHGKPNS